MKLFRASLHLHQDYRPLEGRKSALGSRLVKIFLEFRCGGMSFPRFCVLERWLIEMDRKRKHWSHMRFITFYHLASCSHGHGKKQEGPGIFISYVSRSWLCGVSSSTNKSQEGPGSSPTKKVF